MSYQKCDSMAKPNLFTNKRNGFESKLKQNVLYRESGLQSLRPTFRLDRLKNNLFNKSQTNGNNSKNSSNQRTNSSPVKAKQTFVNIFERNSYSTDAIKPVIQVKPKAVNYNKTKTEDKFESKAPDIRRISARSASLPAISMRLNPSTDLSTDSDNSEEESPNCQQVMNNIRRRVSQIIDLHHLSGDEDRHESSDSQESESQINYQRTGEKREMSSDIRHSKTNESGFYDKHLFSLNNKQKQRQELNDKEIHDSSSDDNQRLDLNDFDYKLLLRRHENKQKSDENSSEDSNEDNTEKEENFSTKQKYYENLRKNSYSMIDNFKSYRLSES